MHSRKLVESLWFICFLKENYQLEAKKQHKVQPIQFKQKSKKARQVSKWNPVFQINSNIGNKAEHLE